jgi:hypothetical protein
MPSGFQNAVDQLQAEMYRVTVTMSNTTYYPTADGNTNGGVTPNAWDAFSVLPTTLVLGKARARGNMRFRNVVNRLQGLGDCQIRDITITEANASAQATLLIFTVNYERPSSITLGGTAVDGSTAMSTTDIVIRNAVVQGVRDTTTAQARVYDPAVGVGGTQQSITVSPADTAANMWATVVVSLIDESTLFD